MLHIFRIAVDALVHTILCTHHIEVLVWLGGTTKGFGRVSSKRLIDFLWIVRCVKFGVWTKYPPKYIVPKLYIPEMKYYFKLPHKWLSKFHYFPSSWNSLLLLYFIQFSSYHKVSFPFQVHSLSPRNKKAIRVEDASVRLQVNMWCHTIIQQVLNLPPFLGDNFDRPLFQ